MDEFPFQLPSLVQLAQHVRFSLSHRHWEPLDPVCSQTVRRFRLTTATQMMAKLHGNDYGTLSEPTWRCSDQRSSPSQWCSAAHDNGNISALSKSNSPPFRVSQSVIERQGSKLLLAHSTRLSMAVAVASKTTVTGPQSGTCSGSEAGAFVFDLRSLANQSPIVIDIRLRVRNLAAIATRGPALQKEAEKMT